MNAGPLDIEALRRVMIDAPEPTSTRVVAWLVSLTFLLLVFNLVRRGKLKEEYTPIWVVVALGIMTLSMSSGVLRWMTHAIGAWTASSTLFFFGELFLLVLCLNYAVRLSRMNVQLKRLAQEIALLRNAGEGRRAAE